MFSLLLDLLIILAEILGAFGDLYMPYFFFVLACML